jgi:hypothetical protein
LPTRMTLFTDIGGSFWFEPRYAPLDRRVNVAVPRTKRQVAVPAR